MVKIKPLLASLGISLGTGGLAALLTRNNMEVYASLKQPPLAPPGWLFPIVWVILYILMGIAAYLVWEERRPGRDSALRLYGAQLVFNFVWTLIFFNAMRYGLALLWLLVFWALLLLTTVRFFRQTKPAGWLMLPYLLWVTFAGYLNAGVWLLNR